MRPATTPVPSRWGRRGAVHRMVRPRGSPRVARPRRAWDWVSWRTSLLLFFGPVVFLVATILVGRGPAPPQADDADRAGRIGIERSRGPAPTGPDGAESDPPAIELGVGGGATHSGEPRPITVVGRITDKQTGAPLAGAVVSVVSGDLPVDTTATTGADGSYVLTDVPAGGLVRVERRE